MKCLFNRVAEFFGSVVDVILILIVVWGCLILLFVVGGFLAHSCDLRHGFIFFSFLFWCVSEVCVGISYITNWVAMAVVESEERCLSVSFSKLVDAVNEFLGHWQCRPPVMS